MPTTAVKKISHIGIAVHSIEEAAKFYEKLDLEIEAVEIVESQKVKVAFISIGEVRIELLEPTSSESTVAKYLEKKGEGIHHIALSTDNLQDRLTELENQGIRLIDKEPRSGAHNADIAFLHPKSTHGILLELCEEHQ
ncbi:MAG: methylmalonyl-CoA epimerase [Candidatus Cloacimonetes bacterium]|nr:methylmalonyl-CoA epimerase [Candidatus Cloacimonadota bacterium]MCF7813452.1 methylmalonyl-CoA epimerase [Candidatus Cloacimonadota bacterium]MCF7867745.1 methylmalonyl-CoA epimerase [Candidatus Cloacimonadota bacterium]MCF7883169.1 methylmalonyl-CoA epimerase [Candidatus Cloacimonadota bacterium]